MNKKFSKDTVENISKTGITKHKNVALITSIVLLTLAVGLTIYALSLQDSSSSGSHSHSELDDHIIISTSKAPVGSTVITFTNNGFDKDSYNAKPNEAVTVMNTSSMDLQFSSGDHPTHHDHPELNMDVLSAGESGTFTPPGKGTYSFHDHLNDNFTGTLIVE